MSDNEHRADHMHEKPETEATREQLLAILRLLAKEVTRRLPRKDDAAETDHGLRSNY